MSTEREDTAAEQIQWDDIPAETQHELVALADTLGSDTPEEDAEATLSRRDVIAALGTAGVGAAIGGGAGYSMMEPASAGHGQGSIGAAGDPIDTAYVTSIDGDGDNVGVTPALGDVSSKALNRTHFYSEYSTLQAAINAIDETDYTDGRVFVDHVAPTSSDYIDETVTLVGWQDFRGFGVNTYLSGSGNHTVTAPAGEQDGSISHMWIDNRDASTYDAIHIAESEWVVGPHVDVDNAGRHALHIDAARCKVNGLAVLNGASSSIEASGVNLTGNADNITAEGIEVEGNGTTPVNGITVANGQVRGTVEAVINETGGTGAVIGGNGTTYHIRVDNAGDRGIELTSNADWNTVYGGAMRSTNANLYVAGNDNVCIGRFDDVTIASGASDTVIYGRIPVSITDNGNRTVINGNSTNSGDPSSTGQWNTNAAQAYRHGVTVWDTSTTTATPYKATPGGSWVAI